MTNCIGWAADPPCRAWGVACDFHGCRYEAGKHPGLFHRCKCGSTLKTTDRSAYQAAYQARRRAERTT